MAISNLTGIDFGSVVSSIPGVSTVIRLSQVAIVIVIVYIIFLIIRSIVQINYSLRFKRLTKNVEEINKKMDKLISASGKRK